MIIMDTNVLSELMRQQPDSSVLKYINGLDATELAITAITAGEVMHGIIRLPDGKRKSALHASFQDLLSVEFSRRALPYDLAAADCYANLVTAREKLGRPISMADGQIAAICLSNKAALATRNTKDFEHIGLALVNPWTA